MKLKFFIVCYLISIYPRIFLMNFVEASLNCTTEKDACDINPNIGIKNDVSTELLVSIGTRDIRKDFLTLSTIKSIVSSFDRHCSMNIQQHSLTEKHEITMDMMKLHYMTPCQNISASFASADDIWTNPKFDASKTVILAATGWNVSFPRSVTIKSLAESLLCRNDVNLVVIENNYYADTPYVRAALNTAQVGELVAIVLQSLNKVVPLERIHLIGHSLGAHIMGAAGRSFNQLTGKKIGRITGLDPAKPCFSQSAHKMSITKTDADFIDIIHSNNGLLGKSEPIGTIDFYPGGDGAIVPDCKSIFCSHQRSVGYFVETVYPENEQKYLGQKCATWNDLLKKECSDTDKTPMGYAVNRDLKGIYYVYVKPIPGTEETETDTGTETKTEKTETENVENQKCNVCNV